MSETDKDKMLRALAEAWRRRSLKFRRGLGVESDRDVADVLLACAVALELVLDGKNA